MFIYMKKLLSIVFFLVVACSQQDSVPEDEREKNEPPANTTAFKAIPFDSLTLKQLVLHNDKLLGFPGTDLGDRFDKITQDDYYRLSLYKACNFTVMYDKKCNGYRHLLISKEKDRDQVYLEP